MKSMVIQKHRTAVTHTLTAPFVQVTLTTFSTAVNVITVAHKDRVLTYNAKQPLFQDNLGKPAPERLNSSGF